MSAAQLPNQASALAHAARRAIAAWPRPLTTPEPDGDRWLQEVETLMDRSGSSLAWPPPLQAQLLGVLANSDCQDGAFLRAAADGLQASSNGVGAIQCLSSMLRMRAAVVASRSGEIVCVDEVYDLLDHAAEFPRKRRRTGRESQHPQHSVDLIDMTTHAYEALRKTFAWKLVQRAFDSQPSRGGGSLLLPPREEVARIAAETEAAFPTLWIRDAVAEVSELLEKNQEAAAWAATGVSGTAA
eukprot:TRINITY_DN76284_c0_g1_i1.p1 TRINITY_DN76284_c0_g1~~TRINITY_DN76284_c0_g1_i1.p1  ORF type:complete len:242 (-),score=50.89 TRINITY_DN76284_c0_g1_i1:99-824(-)